MKRNIKEIVVTIQSKEKLSIIQNTFAIKTLFYDNGKKLLVGDNELKVNHANYANLLRMQLSLFTITEKTKNS